MENCPGVPCIITPPPPSFTCGTSTINDVDGNAYNTVLIGTQCWTLENLKVTKYNDGTSIPLDNSGSSTGSAAGATWSSKVTGAYTIYANEPSTGTNATNYGFLYNWYAAVGIITNGGSPTKNICPTGSHVPTDAEWTTLITYLGGESVAGGKMKSTSSLWDVPNTGATNSSGFSVLPGGYRINFGSFSDVRGSANFWSANEMVTNLKTPGSAPCTTALAMRSEATTPSRVGFPFAASGIDYLWARLAGGRRNIFLKSRLKRYLLEKIYIRNS